jgi:Na+-transporting methylmalonyl-CoA/oxaloacetate decarboxylase gamma subunit
MNIIAYVLLLIACFIMIFTTEGIKLYIYIILGISIVFEIITVLAYVAEEYLISKGIIQIIEDEDNNDKNQDK